MSDLNRLAGELTALEAEETRIAETVWSKDLLAQQCGRVFEELWDPLNVSTNRFAILANLDFVALQPGRRDPDTTVGHGITLFRLAGVSGDWSMADWRALLAELQAAGWEIGALEIRHNRFEVDPNGKPRRSLFHELLRTVRDRVLSETPEGRQITTLYYQYGPALAQTLDNNEGLKQEARKMIDAYLGLRQ